MAARRNLIVVSNRGPASFTRDEEGDRVARRGGGGLVTALRSFVAHHDVTWIASAMTDEDRAVAEEAGGEAVDAVARDGSPYRLRLIAHQPSAYDWYYNVVSNPTLWFIQHYLWALAYAPNIDPGLHHAWEDGYVPVNRGFADAVLDELEAKPNASVFFHDYHLYLAPRFVPSRTSGGCSPSRFATRSTTGCSRTTSSAFTQTGGAGASCARARISSTWTATSTAASAPTWEAGP